jgi:hypothetical protein
LGIPTELGSLLGSKIGMRDLALTSGKTEFKAVGRAVFALAWLEPLIESGICANVRLPAEAAWKVGVVAARIIAMLRNFRSDGMMKTFQSEIGATLRVSIIRRLANSWWRATEKVQCEPNYLVFVVGRVPLSKPISNRKICPLK